MDELRKMIEKKKGEGKELNPMYKDSKMSMLKMLRNEMSGMMKDDLVPKKIEVASDDEEGLKEGLEKAKELMGEKAEDGDADMLMAKYKEDPSEENLEALMSCLEKMKKGEQHADASEEAEGDMNGHY